MGTARWKGDAGNRGRPVCDASAETAVSPAGQTATSSHCRLPQGHTAQVSYAVKPWLDAATMRILAFQ
jgi:hypothetical protein